MVRFKDISTFKSQRHVNVVEKCSLLGSQWKLDEVQQNMHTVLKLFERRQKKKPINEIARIFGQILD